MKCMKEGCETDFDNNGVIHVIYPILFKGKWLEVHLCRSHFYEADRMNYAEIRKWLEGAE